MAKRCAHCNTEISEPESKTAFCCIGCQLAYTLIQGLNLSKYYELCKTMHQKSPPKVSNFITDIEYTSAVENIKPDHYRIYLLVEGMHCGSCVWLIEHALQQQPNVLNARVNLTTKRLTLEWKDSPNDIEALVKVVHQLGYRLIPYQEYHNEPKIIGTQQKELLWDVAIAGFATAQVMMLAVGIWAGNMYGSMGLGTRQFLHWLIAAISVPATLYSGKTFFRSTYIALRAGRSNMDVPITIGIIATLLVSIQETWRYSAYTYYDSALMLIFVLLISRYLDAKVRNQVHVQAQELLARQPRTAMLMHQDQLKMINVSQLKAGDIILVAAGEIIPIDGQVITGDSEVNTSIITGETIPQSITANGQVYAGTLNINAPLQIIVGKTSAQTLLSEIVALIESATQSKAKFVQLADRVARWYTPTVLGLSTFTLAAWLYMGAGFHNAILYAVSVLLITCPCAMALAVPAVQIVASTRLLKHGILLKSADALERLESIDIIALDKTGTLTLGHPQLVNKDNINNEDWSIIIAMASRSRHPLCKAIIQAHSGSIIELTVEEVQGAGLRTQYDNHEFRLGSAAFCNVAAENNDLYQEMWFTPLGGTSPIRLQFEDVLRPDAPAVIQALQAMGYQLCILSGDRKVVVAAVAHQLNVENYEARLLPQQKYQRIEALQSAGHKVLMLGDGLNDVAVLKLAHASMSPASGLDLSQNSADVVFYGNRLQPVVETIRIALKAARIVWQNFALAFGYNIIAVPVAALGLITPVFAAVAMSLSSLCVVLNALRLK